MQGLSLILSSLIQLYWLANRPLVSARLRSRSAGVFLCGFWEPTLRLQHLYNKPFPTEPSPQPSLLFSKTELLCCSDKLFKLLDSCDLLPPEYLGLLISPSVLFCSVLSLVLGREHRVLCTWGKCSNTKLHPHFTFQAKYRVQHMVSTTSQLTALLWNTLKGLSVLERMKEVTISCA